MVFALLALANPARRITWNDRTAEDTEQLHGVTPNIGVLIIGFRGPLYYDYNKEPPSSIGNY